MARNKIRWRDSDEAELKRVVRNFNAKVSRLNKRDHNLAAGIELLIPEKVSAAAMLQEMKDRIQNDPDFNRNEFNRELNKLKRFSDRGAEKAVIPESGAFAITKWEKAEAKRDLNRINRKREQHREELLNQQATKDNEPLNMTRKEMKSVRENELHPKSWRFDKVQSAKQWQVYAETIRDQSKWYYENERLQLLKDNYIKGLTEENFSQDIIDLVESIPNDIFEKVYYAEQHAEIGFIYDLIEKQEREKSLKKIWSSNPIIIDWKKSLEAEEAQK